MKWLTFRIQREPGFRFNLIDAGLIVFLCLLSLAVWRLMPDSSLFWAPLYLGMSFFLFCNVFRIGNRLEPYWYVPFFLLAAYALISFDMVSFWWLVLVVMEPLKWGLILYCIRSGTYHGAFYRQLARR